MKVILFFSFAVILLACETTIISENNLEKSLQCDCKDLQHDPDYNVLHLGDRLKPFTGKCLDYYRGGQLKKDFTLKDGKYEGTLLFYHSNGALQSTAEYKKGLLFGVKKVYGKKSDLLFHGIYKRSRLIQTIFNINLPSADSVSVTD